MNNWSENVVLDFSAGSYLSVYKIMQCLLKWACNLKKTWPVTLDILIEKFHRLFLQCNLMTALSSCLLSYVHILLGIAQAEIEVGNLALQY